MSNSEKVSHMLALKEEVKVLKTMIRPHDTGHIHTTISTLQDRIKTLYKEVYSREARN
tara:strand:- start:58228 stop:58401 length:174 start_codon:yes stop_codon:yes gene_type:complete